MAVELCLVLACGNGSMEKRDGRRDDLVLSEEPAVYISFDDQWRELERLAEREGEEDEEYFFWLNSSMERRGERGCLGWTVHEFYVWGLPTVEAKLAACSKRKVGHAS